MRRAKHQGTRRGWAAVRVGLAAMLTVVTPHGTPDTLAGRIGRTLLGYRAPMPGYEMSKEQLLARLRRVEGQIRGLQQMVEADRYCVDVLTQIAAVTKALQSVAVGLLDDHLRHCVADAVATGGSEADRKLGEATAAIERLLKS